VGFPLQSLAQRSGAILLCKIAWSATKREAECTSLSPTGYRAQRQRKIASQFCHQPRRMGEQSPCAPRGFPDIEQALSFKKASSKIRKNLQ
jgi:hypothetical protein